MCGGHLHIAVDDYNLSDEDLAFCRSEIEADGSDPLQTETLVSLEMLSETDRFSALALSEGLWTHS